MVSWATLESVSRRKALWALAVGIACGPVGDRSTFAQSTLRSAVAEGGPGPTFTRDGPNARLYGLDEGYPIQEKLQAVVDGNPWAPKYRVGAFSHLDEIYATRMVHAPAMPSTFRRSNVDVSYRFRGQPSSLPDYLTRNPVTGLLIARDDRILFERYQYGRTDHDRMLSQSMVKSLIGTP